MRSGLLILAAILISVSVAAQRDLAYVADVSEDWPAAVKFGEKVLFTGNNLPYLEMFVDDGGLMRVSYPFVDGVQLRYGSIHYGSYQPAVIYNSQAVLKLWKGAVPYLYQFSGTSFTRIPIPGTIVSRPMVFGPYLYILSQSGGNVQLYRYNGVSVSAVSVGTIPVTRWYDLIAAGSYLYVIAEGFTDTEPTIVKRYNGAGFITLPPVGFRGTITGIYPVGDNAYFKYGNEAIVYFNGSTVTTVYRLPAAFVYAALWRGSLYFLATIETDPATVPLYRVSAGAVSTISLPPGAKFSRASNFAIYNDALYLMAFYDASDDKVIRYDGTAFSEIFNIPGGIQLNGNIFTRESNLLVHPGVNTVSSAYEYNGSTFTEIKIPAGVYPHFLYKSLPSATCNHLWYSLYFDGSGGFVDHREILLKESRGCPVAAIPEHFYDFERADVNFFGKDRGWCWSEIIIDWVIEPCGFPDPCPEPEYLVSMFDMNNKPAWQKMVDKPSVLAVPLKDDQPLGTKIKSGQHDLFVLAGNLVEKGIESISVSLKPAFKIAATTDKNVSVPLKVELLGKNGEILWSKEFTAPFSQQINDKIQQPGQTLRFSVPGTQSKNIITRLDVYPNPSKGNVYLRVKTGNQFAAAELSIISLLGQRVLNRKIEIPFSRQIRLSDIPPGMYVLKIKTAEGESTKMIKLE